MLSRCWLTNQIARKGLSLQIKRERKRETPRRLAAPAMEGAIPVRLSSAAQGFVKRTLILFGIGVLFAFINLFHIQRPLTVDDLMQLLFSPTVWLLLGGGSAAALIGLLFPYVDLNMGKLPHLRAEWNALRCVPIFVGINQACTKISFANDMELALTLSALSVGLWWMFDRSFSGFMLGFFLAFVGTTASDVATVFGPFKTHSQLSQLGFMYYMRLGCIYFTGSITFGNIGRQLALEHNQPMAHQKEHND